jgi:signal transduction histidine kinase/ligand-binding sensor domain-containing protein/AraC-like DNA-binding protein
MKNCIKIFCYVFFILLSWSAAGQNIFRFEHMGSEDGLSQNTAFSILFDSKGFMWIGTMNGLNRYDGYEFKIFRSNPENADSFTNNRVVRLWEDSKGFIWLETYDGYYHFFNPETEIFTSLPSYEGNEVKNITMHSFLQYSDDIILLGSSVSGLFFLNYDPEKNTYNIKHYTAGTTNSISDDRVRFIWSDHNKNIWIGTYAGLNLIPEEEALKENPGISSQLMNTSFTSVCETNEDILFGTEDKGILLYNQRSGSYGELNSLKSDRIAHLYHTNTGYIVVDFEGEGVMISDSTGSYWYQIPFHGKNIDRIYEDRYDQLWLTAVEFGVTRIDLNRMMSRYYIMTPEEIKPLTDLERPQFYEDSQNNLWIGLHGSGLALYDRENDSFEFFRNDPGNPNTISSNFVHCIVEDNNGQLWLGTGQILGGIEKIILKNSAFEHYLPGKERIDILDNVARAVLEDRNRFLWVATKAGRLHLFDSTLKQVNLFIKLPGVGDESLRNTTYSFFNDSQGYLWIGSKGYGLSVSTDPLPEAPVNYNGIRFRRFAYSEDDTTTLSNNNIYSVCQDRMNNIWIGTFGNGLNLVRNPHDKEPKFIRITQQNSNLSSNLIRHLIVDSSGNLWVATTFGLNFLERKNMETGNFHFKIFLRNPSDNTSLIYNDVIHIYEDSRGTLWFGTFGGGVDRLDKFDGTNAIFRHYNLESDPGLGIIFGILEDSKGNLWLSTENGLICLNPENGNTEIYNSLNGLGFNIFSENTCFRRKDGSLVFGGYLGFEVIRPEKIIPKQVETHIELTKLLLFNKEVPINQKGSPLKKSISFVQELSLRYFQSSFSIDYSALDYLDPDRIQYAYKLDNLEDNWNYVGNQHRAVYTNLSPGKYIFRVKSIQPNSNSTSPERILNIRISPPWWKTTMAYFFYALLIVAITTMVYNAITRINRYKNALAIEKKVNELKLQFFTNISHEIRTPLTMIIGPLEDMIADKNISSLKRLQMDIMLKNARRMIQLTNQLLDFRKVQSNKMVLKIREIDIVQFTREIFDTFGPLASHKGINCSLHSCFESFTIFADPNKLDTIIYNVISNAIKFTPTGKNVSVNIEESQRNNSIDIAVTDEGPGIPQKNLADIFTRYTILSNQELAGTGIGLSLSYELARLHKGDIFITSVVGKGSTFIIRLLKGKEHFLETSVTDTDEIPEPGTSFLPAPDQNEQVFDEEIVKFSDSSDKNVMLVVEDNQEILNYICQSLRSFFICIGAKDGNEGLHLSRTMNPDIIVTDIKMPGMDGMEMTRLLKEDFSTSHIPVIMVTSKTDLKDQIEGIETGAEAYIVKPFNIEYLKTVAGNLISQRSKVIARFIDNKPVEADLKVTSKDQEFLKKIVSYINNNYSSSFSIDILAENCNVSRTVFYNKIKGLTGSSPIEFVRKMKLNLAIKLLENGFNVSEAAYRTGFSDVKYFSKLFKAQFGYNPSRHKIDS